jgi:hypothetical protein
VTQTHIDHVLRPWLSHIVLVTVTTRASGNWAMSLTAWTASGRPPPWRQLSRAERDAVTAEAESLPLPGAARPIVVREMAEVVLFHHVQGLTDGVRAFAGELTGTCSPTARCRRTTQLRQRWWCSGLGISSTGWVS